MNPDNSSPDDSIQNQAAAANVLRSQISSLYGPRTVNPRDNTTAAAPATPPVVVVDEDTNPYHRTHTANPEPQADQWKQYHSAWQNYYQKYYEGYYTHQLTQSSTPATPTSHYFSSEPTDAQETSEALSSDQALLELRQKLLGRVQASAHKIRKSRHFIPITAALVVVLAFVFIQYNQILIGTVAAYVSPGSIDPQNIVVNPNTDVVVSSDPRLIIPKINVDVPVMYDVGSDYDSQMAAMQKGVAHFAIPGASSHPGEIGNTAIAGHSSNDLFDSGDYKFIFAQLEKLAPGDSIYANYLSKRYTYVVTKVEVVQPTDISKLVYPTDKPILTLITCTPLGTSLNRLLVTAEQVSPDPAAAAAAPTTAATQSTTIPGASAPTLFERLFGGAH